MSEEKAPTAVVASVGAAVDDEDAAVEDALRVVDDDTLLIGGEEVAEDDHNDGDGDEDLLVDADVDAEDLVNSDLDFLGSQKAADDGGKRAHASNSDEKNHDAEVDSANGATTTTGDDASNGDEETDGEGEGEGEGDGELKLKRAKMVQAATAATSASLGQRSGAANFPPRALRRDGILGSGPPQPTPSHSGKGRGAAFNAYLTPQGVNLTQLPKPPPPGAPAPTTASTLPPLPPPHAHSSAAFGQLTRYGQDYVIDNVGSTGRGKPLLAGRRRRVHEATSAFDSLSQYPRSPHKVVYPASVLPISSSEESGWSMHLSRKGFVFWSNAEKKAQQWEQPEAVQECLWRICIHPNGKTSYYNTELCVHFSELPEPQPLAAYDDPCDWILEEDDEAGNSAKTWFNPRLLLLAFCTPPMMERGFRKDRCHWHVQKPSETERLYVHKYTRMTIIRDLASEDPPAKRAEEVVVEEIAPSETALKRKIMVYTDDMKRTVFNNSGSKRSLKMRERILNDLQILERPDGSARVVRRDTRAEIAILTPRDLEIYDANGHLKQVFLNGRGLEDVGRQFNDADRILKRDHEGRVFPRTPYSRRQGEAKTVEFWYPRYTMLADIEFLTQCGHMADTVVVVAYTGALYYNKLAEEYFPNHRFIIYPQGQLKCESTSMVRVMSSPFTVREAEKYEGKSVIFISWAKDPNNMKHKGLAPFMLRQREWVHTMRPAISHLRFTLPWPNTRLPAHMNTARYFDGELRLPFWGVVTGTEVGLVVSNWERETVYDYKDWEDALFHHNVFTRVSYFHHNITGEGLCHCYDCSSEIHILDAYLRHNKPSHIIDEDEIKRAIARLSARISRTISKIRTLVIK